MNNSKVLHNTKSSEKEKSNAKTFRIPISNGIFEHYARLKDASWLLYLFVDWTTKEVPAPDGSRDGLVLGGKPIRDEDTASAFGCCDRTTRRWRKRLARFGYIEQLRTPVGYVIRVKRSKKWPGRADKNVPSERTKMSDHSQSEVQDVSGQSCQTCPVRTTDHVRSNKDSAVQDRDKAVVEAATTTASSLLIAKNKEAWKAIAEACGSDDATLDPIGDPRFQAVWESTFAQRPNTERLDDTMERCILACRGQRIPIPKTFYDAKRCVENSESRYALNVEPDEVARVAGPRGVRPELMR